jgi:hypothetical protein
MLNRKTYHSSSETYLNRPFDRLLATLMGHVAQWIYPGRSCRSQHAVSIQIVSQIPQPHLGLHPDQTNNSHDQPPRLLRLNHKDMFHTAPDSGTIPIALSLSIRQLLMPASFALKMLLILPFLQLSELLLRTIRRVRPYIPTAVILIQKSFKYLTVMDRRRGHLITTNQFMFHIHIDMILIAVVVLSILFGPPLWEFYRLNRIADLNVTHLYESARQKANY